VVDSGDTVAIGPGISADGPLMLHVDRYVSPPVLRVLQCWRLGRLIRERRQIARGTALLTSQYRFEISKV